MFLENPALYYFEALSESADQIFFAYDIASGKFSLLSPAFEKVWHKTRKSVQGNPAALLKTIHPEDKQLVEQMYQELLEGAIIKDFQFRIVLRDKKERWVCVKPRLLGEELVLIGTADDITAPKEYNDYLKKYSDKKNSILNILSHDLAGPLGMINNLSRMLEEDTKSTGNEEMHKMIGLIARSSKQGMQFIQEFLKQEFLESASVELIKHRVDLVQVIRESMFEYQMTEQMLGKNFHFLPASEKLYLELDDNKFMQVINNLISNAIKFTPDGGEITVALEEKVESVLITVADTGIGIPEKFWDTLFEKFTRARRTGIKGEPSVGLGMSIIKTIVEWHQGKIWFESHENKGTTFYIEVPKTTI
jgi:two-component system, OmpR family, sensor histidine kinase VicK